MFPTLIGRSDVRFLPIGPRAFLAELGDLDQTMRLFDALQADPVPGIADIVPGMSTLLIRTEVGIAADAAMARAMSARLTTGKDSTASSTGETIELPVTYDGADLADVAEHMGLTVAEVIAAHQAATWQVAFCGFAPGFAYMVGDDPRFKLPRRKSPRTRIPAGAVGLADRFCGVYPQASPGGWQLIGRTAVPMWDLDRQPPALLRPGVRCRFVQREAKVHPVAVPVEKPSGPGLRILSTIFPILFQDQGRKGHTRMGVSTSGALDMGCVRRANRAVGNPPLAPALEITLGPVRFKAEEKMVVALTGAALANVDGVTIPMGAAFALDAGDVVSIVPTGSGVRSYLALRGGYDVPKILGSSATDTLANIGPKAITAGSVLAQARQTAGMIGAPEPQPPLPKAGAVVELPVVLGPRTDWFDAVEVQRFLTQEWLVTPQSSRVGVRLQGDKALVRSDSRELPSEGTETGAIQVPHSGQPVIFLADHPLTGGYPVIATLRPEALDTAGQLPPGARIRFVADADFAPIVI
jgi:KipI family sensor histidine kinase inhibitor